MYTLYKLNPADLNDNFLQALKLLFNGKTIEIAVREVEAANETHDVWQAIERFRQQINLADYPENEDVFADVRDRSAGREVVL
ncbi:hypothetical protein [Thiofilum flexile]|uniref:hypothetical protein n=1 Tax=Thiofilum flexile TaxID=125627 RepID=UPI00037D00D8|nr:hypothetical protein [Thiofilum flexile]